MMTLAEQVWLWFWTAMVFGSIGWYALLLLVIGYRGGRDVAAMTRALVQDARVEESEPE